MVRLGSVNDAFGFFLSGPGIVGPYSDNAVNLATIPNPVLADQTIPVTINSSTMASRGLPEPPPTATRCPSNGTEHGLLRGQ